MATFTENMSELLMMDASEPFARAVSVVLSDHLAEYCLIIQDGESPFDEVLGHLLALTAEHYV